MRWFHKNLGLIGGSASIVFSALNFMYSDSPRARRQAGVAGFFSWAGDFLGSFTTPVAGTISGAMTGGYLGGEFGNAAGGWTYDTFIDKRRK